MSRVPITVIGYRCDRCAHEWLPRNGATEPLTCPKCKSASWNRPKKGAAPMPYEAFRDSIQTALHGAARPLTWTEIRTVAKLPQAFPNNKWVRQLEAQIGLERRKDRAGIIHWSIKDCAAVDAS